MSVTCFASGRKPAMSYRRAGSLQYAGNHSSFSRRQNSCWTFTHNSSPDIDARSRPGFLCVETAQDGYRDGFSQRRSPSPQTVCTELRDGVSSPRNCEDGKRLAPPMATADFGISSAGGCDPDLMSITSASTPEPPKGGQKYAIPCLQLKWLTRPDRQHALADNGNNRCS